jgi:hypothetical protein
MLAYLVLLLAAVSRLLPHALHGVGLNFTAVGGGLLFFGARRSRWQAGIAAGVMALTDIYLTCCVYNARFHAADYLITWAWYAGVCLLASGLLRRITPLRVVAGVLCSATSFFVLSDLAVWVTSSMYPHTAHGLAECFWLALPFYANDLVSTALTATVLFGLPVVAARLVTVWRESTQAHQPLL